jgi:hypothetical protein
MEILSWAFSSPGSLNEPAVIAFSNLRLTTLLPACGVASGYWKYIHYPILEGGDEVYHLARDSREMHNRIEDPNTA